MLILSLHAAGHDSAAALFRDYDLLAAVQQERLTRCKGDGGLPIAALEEVLSIAGASRSDVDALVLTRAHYPAQFFRLGAYKNVESRINLLFGKHRNKDVAAEAGLGGGRAHDIFDGPGFAASLGLRTGIPIYFNNHHLAHGLSALFHTDWTDALIYTADGGGDNVHYSHRVLGNGRLDCLFGDDRWLAQMRRVDSLGLAYGYATQALGYRMNRHEGKLTGLAGFGKPVQAGAIQQHFTVGEDGLVSSDFASDAAMRAFIQEIAKGCDPADLAASIQHVLEDVMLASVTKLLRRHGKRRLALAGGVFANVRLNRRLCEVAGLDEIFIFPAMGDEGLVIGGALELLLERDGMPAWTERRRRLSDVYWGRPYDDGMVRAFAAHPDIEAVPGDPVAITVDLLARGQAGAIFEGRMEFGPRALGARSILASPADAAVNQRLNARLNRTEFMPFAPYVLAEDAEEVFGVTEANRYACRFMTITTAVKPAWRERIPAVVHVDGTARPQIIEDAANPLYAAILRGFKRATGLPVLVNTSFNAHEEPIINRPEECLMALIHDRVDFVVTRAHVYRRRASAIG